MQTERDLADTAASPTVRVRGPGDLVDMVPFLLGFHPAESLVLVGLSQAQVVVTVRVGLDDLAQADLLAGTVDALCRGGAEELVGVIFDDRAPPRAAHLDLPWHGVRSAVATEADRTGIRLTELLLVSSGRWWSYLCSDAGCCPQEGQRLAPAGSVVHAAATFAGLVALPDRSAMAALLDPSPEAERAALEPVLAAAERAVVRAVLDGRDARQQRSVKRALFAAARAAAPPGGLPPLPNDEVARFAVALNAYPVRDAVWMAVDDGRLDGRELWRNLARRLPAPHDAGPLFLFGWASWRAGNGALAGIAAERALASSPAYTAADLLLAVLSRGLDPRSLPKLRSSRPA